MFASLHTRDTTVVFFTLSLHDALPISLLLESWNFFFSTPTTVKGKPSTTTLLPTGSTPLPKIRSARASSSMACPSRWRSEEHTSNSSHGYISYAVFCLKKKLNIDHIFG